MAAVASAHVDSAILIVLSTRFTQCFAILDEDSSLGWKCCEDILQHSGYNADMADKVKAVVGKALRKAFGAELRWKKYRRSDGSRRNLYSLKPIDPWPIVNPPAIMYGLMSTCTGTVNDNRKLADNPRSSPKFSDPPKHYNSEYSRGDSQARYRQNHTTYEDNFDPYYKFSGQPEYTRSTTAMNPRHHASERESERSTGTSAVRYENFGLLNETMLPWDTNRQIHPGSRYYTASNHYESRQGRLDWKRPQPRHDVYTGTNLDTDNVQFDLRRPNITLSHVHTSQSQQQEARTGSIYSLNGYIEPKAYSQGANASEETVSASSSSPTPQRLSNSEQPNILNQVLSRRPTETQRYAPNGERKHPYERPHPYNNWTAMHRGKSTLNNDWISPYEDNNLSLNRANERHDQKLSHPE